MTSSSAATPRLPGRNAITIAMTAMTSATSARMSPSESAARGAIRRSCISAAAWTTTPTAGDGDRGDAAAAAVRRERFAALLVGGDGEPDGSDQVAGDGDQWQ